MTLYLLKNINSGKFYIGTTSNLKLRLIEHNNHNNHYTGRIEGRWQLLYNIEFTDYTEARSEEKRLKKSKNKKYILWYFQNRATSSTGRAVPS